MLKKRVKLKERSGDLEFWMPDFLKHGHINRVDHRGLGWDAESRADWGAFGCQPAWSKAITPAQGSTEISPSCVLAVRA